MGDDPFLRGQESAKADADRSKSESEWHKRNVKNGMKTLVASTAEIREKLYRVGYYVTVGDDGLNLSHCAADHLFSDVTPRFSDVRIGPNYKDASEFYILIHNERISDRWAESKLGKTFGTDCRLDGVLSFLGWYFEQTKDIAARERRRNHRLMPDAKLWGLWRKFLNLR